LLAGKNSEINSREVLDLYEASYVVFEKVVADPSTYKTEALLQWGISLTNHYKLKGLKEEEAEKIFETAQQKYETSLLTASDTTHIILYNWGILLLEKGKKLKEAGRNDLALESLSKSCGKFSESFANKPTYSEALQSWRLALSEQSTLADGNQRLWFESQMAEKARWIEKINKNEPVDLPAKIEFSPQEKLQKGNAEKELGNDYFKKGEYVNALKHYHNAMNFANGLYGLPPQQDQALRELKSSVYNNMAVVHLKQGKNDRALTDLKMVLELDGNNVKALFRRGKLWNTIGDIDKSRADLDKAKVLDPNNKEILLEIQSLEKKEKAQAAKQKQIYSKMFE